MKRNGLTYCSVKSDAHIHVNVGISRDLCRNLLNSDVIEDVYTIDCMAVDQPCYSPPPRGSFKAGCHNLVMWW